MSDKAMTEPTANQTEMEANNRLGDLIEECLREYRCQYTIENDDDSGACLVDLLTPPEQKSIALGQAEIESLTDHIVGALIDAGYIAAAKSEAPDESGLAERLKLEAQIHAQEARTANSAIAEIYQLCTGNTGEPGNWNGAAPVRELLAKLAEAEEKNERLTEALTPSTETKDAYMGEFYVSLPDIDESSGDEYVRKVNVPWTTIKELMAAILARAASTEELNDR